MNARVVSQLEQLDVKGSGGDAAVILRLSGDLVYEKTHDLVEVIHSMLPKSPRGIILEMSDVNMIDSSGLRTVLQCRRLCLDAGISFKLQAVSTNVARVIDMSGLTRVFGLEKYKNRAHKMAVPAASAGSGSCGQQEHIAPSEASAISILRCKVTDAAVAAGASGETLCDIQIAVGEALTNAYRHGSPQKGKSMIKLRYYTSPKAIIIEVEDEGKPFDPNGTGEPEPSELRDHGMGIYLMRQAMDSVEFTSNCPGNMVRMVKWIKADQSIVA